jgi:hypothetical protein
MLPGSVLRRVQRGLEHLYRVDTQLEVDAFMVDAAGRDQALGASGRRPREQLIVSQTDDEELSLGLFLDPDAIANLEKHDPASGLGDHNFGDFCLAVEGVSHFVYVAVCAAKDRAVSALELELQAEIDKFVSCYLLDEEGDAADLRERLFDRIAYHDDLDPEERARYAVANDAARKYAASLDRRFIRDRRVPEMLHELRRFYRLGLREKLDRIG